MHIIHGNLRKAPFVKVLNDSTMFAVELSEVIKDYKTGGKTYTNYKAILFAKSEAHVNHYNNTLVEGNYIVLTSDKLKIEVSDCGKYTKLYMDNARLEGSGFIQGGQQVPQQQQAPQQFQQQPAHVNPQQVKADQWKQQKNASSQNVDFDDTDIPF